MPRAKFPPNVMRSRSDFFGLEERIVNAIGLDGISPEGNALMQELQLFFDSLVYKPDLRFTNLIDAPQQTE